MSEKSAIEWTDATWSPWEGCTKVSPGCDHCYAQRMNGWLRKGENWGPGAPRREYGDDHWDKPLKWNAAAAKAGKRVKVFPSVCDPFDNDAPARLRERFMSLIARTPNLDWLVLTKRIGNAKRMLSDASMHDGLLLTANDEYRPPANLWLGATIVNQEEADRDIPKLLATPARVRFLSMEPLLSEVDVTPHLWGRPKPCHDCPKDGDCVCGFTRRGFFKTDAKIDWIIAGGESGRGARPMHPAWARSVRDQCKAAGVPFLFKQWGEYHPSAQHDAKEHGCTATPTALFVDGTIEHRPLEAGADIFYKRAAGMCRVGKKAAGRLLDGCTHDEFPAEVAHA